MMTPKDFLDQVFCGDVYYFAEADKNKILNFLEEVENKSASLDDSAYYNFCMPELCGLDELDETDDAELLEILNGVLFIFDNYCMHSLSCLIKQMEKYVETLKKYKR